MGFDKVGHLGGWAAMNSPRTSCSAMDERSSTMRRIASSNSLRMQAHSKRPSDLEYGGKAGIAAFAQRAIEALAA